MNDCFPFFLQRIIFFVVFVEIQSLRLCGNSLAGIVTEFAALSGQRYNTFFNTQNLFVIDLRTMQAIHAGLFYLFSKEHSGNSLVLFAHYIHFFVKKL